MPVNQLSNPCYYPDGGIVFWGFCSSQLSSPTTSAGDLVSAGQRVIVSSGEMLPGLLGELLPVFFFYFCRVFPRSGCNPGPCALGWPRGSSCRSPVFKSCGKEVEAEGCACVLTRLEMCFPRASTSSVSSWNVICIPLVLLPSISVRRCVFAVSNLILVVSVAAFWKCAQLIHITWSITCWSSTPFSPYLLLSLPHFYRSNRSWNEPSAALCSPSVSFCAQDIHRLLHA